MHDRHVYTFKFYYRDRRGAVTELELRIVGSSTGYLAEKDQVVRAIGQLIEHGLPEFVSDVVVSDHSTIDFYVRLQPVQQPRTKTFHLGPDDELQLVRFVNVLVSAIQLADD